MRNNSAECPSAVPNTDTIKAHVSPRRLTLHCPIDDHSICCVSAPR